MIWNKKKIPNILSHTKYILYLHGGAFCYGNTNTIKKFLSIIAYKTNSVLMSVDYRMAPENKHPIPLNDCVEAYTILINSINLELKPTIIVMGDSAGGNLVAALTNLLIEWGFRKPEGIVLVYPALNLSYL
mgnify:CR=1 FL=1